MPLLFIVYYTVNYPHGDLVLSGVSICASPNLDILGMKFDTDCRMLEVRIAWYCFSRLSEKLYFMVVNRVVVDHLCYFVATKHLFSQYWRIVLRSGEQLLHAIVSFSSVRCIRWPGFALIKISCYCVIHLMFLDFVCWTRLIQTRIIVYSVSCHLHLPEFDIPEFMQLIH